MVGTSRACLLNLSSTSQYQSIDVGVDLLGRTHRQRRAHPVPQQISAQHAPLLQHLPYLDDLQASWLLVLHTASTRSNYLLRMLPPHLTTQFAQQHDASITACLAQLLETTNFPAAAISRAHLPLTAGGLGLPSAMLHATPAYWASWADALAVLHKQDPTVTDTLLHHLANPSETSSHITAASQARTDLQDQGWDPPSWDELAAGQAPPHGHEEVGNGPVQPGWQRQAATPYHTAARAELYHTLDPPAQAMLDSQSGPLSGRGFTSIPYTPDATYPGPLFRLLLLRRLRLPLPLSDRICWSPWRPPFSMPKDGGTPQPRGATWDSCSKNVPRGRSTSHNAHQDHRPQHSCTMLPGRKAYRGHCKRPPAVERGTASSWHNTCCSLNKYGQPRRRGALHEARQAKERVYPELQGMWRCRLVVFGIEVGGRWSTQAAQFLRSLAHTKARTVPAQLRHAIVTALIARWSASLTHAAMHAYAASLLSMSPSSAITGEEDLPPLGQLLAQHPEASTTPSRLPGLWPAQLWISCVGFPFWLLDFFEWPRNMPFSETRFRKRGVEKKILWWSEKIEKYDSWHDNVNFNICMPSSNGNDMVWWWRVL